MLKSTEVLASLLYTRDNDGQVKGVTSKGLPGEEKPVYEYDPNNRLTKGAGTSYEYDAANTTSTSQGWLVAPITNTPSLLVRPSISDSSWLTVPRAALLRRWLRFWPSASTSSKNTTHGARLRAASKIPRTLRSL